MDDINLSQPDPVTVEDIKLKMPVAVIADSEDKRRTLTDWLINLIQGGQSAKGGLVSIWDDVAREFRDEAPDADDTMGEGLASTHIGIMSPRMETLASQVNTITLNQDLYMLADVGGDDELASRLETLLHNQWRSGGLERATRLGTIEAGISNRFHYKVSFDINVSGVLSENADQVQLRGFGFMRYAGLKLDAIQAYDFIIAPSVTDGIQSSTIVGHRFWQTAVLIKELQGIGVYFKDETGAQETLGGDSPTQTNKALGYYNAQVAPEAVRTEDTDLVECYEVYFKKAPEEGKRRRWYRAIVATRGNTTLQCEEWPYSRPPYFMSSYLPDLTGYWGGRSVGRKMVPIQSESDRVNTQVYNATMIASAPPAFGEFGDKEDYTETGPGALIPMPPGAQPPYVPPLNFEPGGLLQISAGLERAADSMMQVSTNSLGQEENRATTATQTQAIQQGASVRLSEYVACFTADWPAMAAFSMELLYDNWAIWHVFDSQGESDTIANDELIRDDLKTPCQWEVNGRDPATTPAARRASIAQIAQLAANPATGIDMYAVATAALRYSGVPGAKKFQKEKPQDATPQIPGQEPGQAPGTPGAPGITGQPPSLVAPQAPQAMQGPSVPQSNGGDEPAQDIASPGSFAANQ